MIDVRKRLCFLGPAIHFLIVDPFYFALIAPLVGGGDVAATAAVG